MDIEAIIDLLTDEVRELINRRTLEHQLGESDGCYVALEVTNTLEDEYQMRRYELEREQQEGSDDEL